MNGHIFSLHNRPLYAVAERGRSTRGGQLHIKTHNNMHEKVQDSLPELRSTTPNLQPRRRGLTDWGPEEVRRTEEFVVVDRRRLVGDGRSHAWSLVVVESWSSRGLGDAGWRRMIHVSRAWPRENIARFHFKPAAGLYLWMAGLNHWTYLVFFFCNFGRGGHDPVSPPLRSAGDCMWLHCILGSLR